MGLSVREFTMTDGTSRVNGEAWDERCCCTVGEARAEKRSQRWKVLAANRGREAHGHAVWAAARARPCDRHHSADIGAGRSARRVARTPRLILAASAALPMADRARCALARVWPPWHGWR